MNKRTDFPSSSKSEEIKSNQAMIPDFYYRGKSSVFMLIPKSDKAFRWIMDNLKLQSWQDPEMPVLEMSHFADIGDAIISEGLTLEKAI